MLFNIPFIGSHTDLFIHHRAALADRVTANILVSRAAVQNLNEREYTIDSMKAACDAAQQDIKIGRLFGYVEHPQPVVDLNGEIAGYDQRGTPAFKFLSLVFDEKTNELKAKIEMLDTEPGAILSKKLQDGEQISFSLRALGDCSAAADGRTVCDIEKIDGADAVETPALPDARVLSAVTDCACPDSKSKPAIKQSFTKQSAAVHKRISGGNLKRPIGDAFMNAEIWKEIEGMTDPETIKIFLKGVMMSMDGPADAPMIEMKTEDSPVDPALVEGAPALDKQIYDVKTQKRLYQDAIAALKDPVKFAAMFKDNKEFEAMIKAQMAGLIPADKLAVIDRVELRDQAEAQRKAVIDAVAALEVGGEVEGRKLADYSEAQLKPIIDRAKEKKTACEAKAAIMDALQVIDENKMTQFNNTVNRTGAKGITVVADGGDKTLEGRLALMDAAVARRDKSRHTYAELKRIEEYKKINKPFVDLLMADHMKNNREAVRDFISRPLRDDANLITSADLRNENGVLAAALKREVFQRLSALQYVDAFGPGPTGQVFKVPVKMYTAPTAGSNRRYYEVRAGESIAEAESALRYNLFSTILRALAFRLGKELEVQIKTGVVGLDAVGETLSDISDDMARQTDSMILAEMQHTCDQYLSVLVSNEAVAAAEWTGAADAVPITVNCGGDIGNVTYGTSATKGPAYAAKLLTGNATTYTGHPSPIVEPLRKVVIDGETNLTTVTDDGRYPVTIDVLGGITQVRGYLDGDGNIQALVPGTTPTYAIDNERGVILFLKTGVSGAAAGTRPTLDYYYATNFDEFNLTPLAGVSPENHYSGLLRLIMQMSGIMASAPRFQSPDWILFHESLARGAFGIADLFENQRSPIDLNLNAGYAASDVIGALPGLTVTQSNGEFFAGARRAILARRDMSSYMVSSPAEVISQPGGNVVGSKVLPTPESVWFLQMMDVVGTAVLIDPTSGAIKKHPGRTIRFLGTLANTVGA